MRIIFLDIDGVLNSKKFFCSDCAYAHPDDNLDPYAIKKLNRIIDQTGAKVVISSSWRLGKSIAELDKILCRNGFKGDIIDKTEDLVSQRKTRGYEIRLWLDHHSNIESFVVIDDFYFPTFYKFDKNFVLTDYRVGLSERDADKCINILKTNYTK
jgi:hypothetical protein